MNKAFIFIHLVLIYFIIDLGVAGGYKFLAGSFEVNKLSTFSTTKVQAIEKKNSHAKSYYQIISTRDLFKTEKIDSPPLEKPPKEEDVNKLEVTDLKLELLGTTTGVGTEPYAVIKQKSNPRQMLYIEGDIIDKALIKTILREKVILVVNGKNQVLLMEKPASRKTRPGVPQRRVNAGKQAGASGDENGFVDTIALKWADIEKLKSNAKNLRKKIKIRPHFSKGKMDGYRVYGIRKNSELTKVGLRNGDIISQVNEKEIRTMQDAMGVYGELNALEGKSAMDLGIKRRGKSGIIRYSIE
jgi:general secretion pathway protein C